MKSYWKCVNIVKMVKSAFLSDHGYSIWGVHAEVRWSLSAIHAEMLEMCNVPGMRSTWNHTVLFQNLHHTWFKLELHANQMIYFLPLTKTFLCFDCLLEHRFYNWNRKSKKHFNDVLRMEFISPIKFPIDFLQFSDFPLWLSRFCLP